LDTYKRHNKEHVLVTWLTQTVKKIKYHDTSLVWQGSEAAHAKQYMYIIDFNDARNKREDKISRK